MNAIIIFSTPQGNRTLGNIFFNITVDYVSQQFKIKEAGKSVLSTISEITHVNA